MRNIKTYESFNSTISEDLDKEVNNLIYFLKCNGINNMLDYHKISDKQKYMFNSLTTNKDKEYQKELQFRIELELSDKEQLKEMLNRYEIKEDFDRCILIQKKLKK